MSQTLTHTRHTGQFHADHNRSNNMADVRVMSPYRMRVYSTNTCAGFRSLRSSALGKLGSFHYVQSVIVSSARIIIVWVVKIKILGHLHVLDVIKKRKRIISR